MKAIRISDQTHARFKAACALHGVPMNATADTALSMFVEAWQEELDVMQAMERISEQAQEHKRNEGGGIDK